MRVLATKAEVREAIAALKAAGGTVALVPTMGALHEGHLSLVRAAREQADHVVVSVFVNPTQFAPGEDLDAYPRDLPRDLSLLEAEGVDLVFAPTPDEMYGPGAEVAVDPGPLGLVLEGVTRPTHFRGVCTVVTKLFAALTPDVALFGEKDYQQLAVIRRLVHDLDLPVRIVGCPIVREADGLAMSSRNVYLSAIERAAATVLSRSLAEARTLADAGETDCRRIAAAMRDVIASEPLAGFDYAEVVDPVTLAPCATLGADGARALLAVRIGATRLIDNAAIGGSTT